jgi:hypothetical protein
MGILLAHVGSWGSWYLDLFIGCVLRLAKMSVLFDDALVFSWSSLGWFILAI